MNKLPDFETAVCGKVPLHQTNLVQPHGVLLVVNKADLRILQASENAPVMFGQDVKQLVATTLHQQLPVPELDALRNRLSSTEESQVPFVFALRTGSYLGLVHLQHDFYLIELETAKRSGQYTSPFLEWQQSLKHLLRMLENEATTEEACKVMAAALKAISGFDKVMVYRFDAGWNGDVIAEVMEPGMESYLGLKFPASDVPRQARELYKKTPYRLIPTIHYDPVKLYPVLNPQSGAFTDLSNSNLRSVAAVHLEYLRNMKVSASMSTRILHNGELWGLIACHHRSPKHLGYEDCVLFELASNAISGRIAAAQLRDQLQHLTATQHWINLLTQRLFRGDGPAGYANVLRELFKADSIAIVLDRQVVLAGDTPAKTAVEDLAVWLGANDTVEVYHQPSLSAVYEPAEEYAGIASGLLALPIGNGEDFILAFRAERLQTLAWGGNPAEAVQYEADGKKYHPRASFTQWQQLVHRTALPWEKADLATAAEVRRLYLAHRSEGQVKR